MSTLGQNNETQHREDKKSGDIHSNTGSATKSVVLKKVPACPWAFLYNRGQGSEL